MIVRKSASRLSFLSLALSLFMSVALLSGCGGGSASTPPSTPGSGTGSSSGGTGTTPTLPTFSILGSTAGNAGQTLVYLVVGGKPPYNILSSAPGVALTTPVTQMGSLYLFSATLIKSGTAMLILSDSSGATASTLVTATAAPLKTTAGTAVTLGVLAEGQYPISGGQSSSYTASSSNASIASAKVIGIPGLTPSTLVIKGLMVGTSTITLCDANCANALTINVTVGGGASGQPLYTAAPDTINMLSGASAQYAIGGGTPPYTASSDTEKLATAVINSSTSGSKLQINTLLTQAGAIQTGTAKITVKDSAGAAATVTVNVGSNGTPLYTTAPMAISLGVGASNAQTYTNSGGTPPYNCTSDNNGVATVSCTNNGSNMTVTGVGKGSANIYVTDATGTNSQKFAVNVASGTNLTVTGDANWTIGVSHCNAPYTAFNPPVYTVYFINGGKPPYTVSSTSPLVGSIIATGSANLQTAIPSTPAGVNNANWTVPSGGYFVVAWPDAGTSYGGPNNLCAEGTASFTITDANGDQPATAPTFKVTLDKTPAPQPPTPTPVPLYTSAPDSFTMATQASAQYIIGGGTAPYTATSNNELIVIAGVNGNKLSITSKTQSGSADIYVKDSSGSGNVKVTANISYAGSPLNTTAPLALTLGLGTSNSQTYINSGGVPPYSCTSDNVNVVTATCNGASMTLNSVGKGTANVFIMDASNTNMKKVAINVSAGTDLVVVGDQANWTIPPTHCNTPYAAYNPPFYSIFFINGGTPPYTVTSSSPLIGTIIGVGSKNAPLAVPTSTAAVDNGSKIVSEAGGYFVVAWPDAGGGAGPNNNCAKGTASFKVIDANGLQALTAPTFKVQ